MAKALPSHKAIPPVFAFPWNGEIRLLSEGGILSGADEDSDSSSKDKKTVHQAVRCCTEVLVKRFPAATVDGPSIDFNIQLSAAMENQQTLMSGMIHMLQTLTCHTDRPGDVGKHYYVVLEHCDYNLEAAARQTRAYISSIRASGTSGEFDESTAPLLLWRARRSVARQLVAGVAFLHRTGAGAFRRVYHNNLKPSNVLLKNGVVKLSEINCYSYMDSEGGGRTPSWPHQIPSTGACSEPLDASEQLQDEYAPPLTVEELESIARLEALAAAGNAVVEDELYMYRAHRDTFALGCLIFYTLTLGKHPFGSTVGKAGKPAPAASNVAKLAPKGLKAIASALQAAATQANAQARYIAEMLKSSAPSSARSSDISLRETSTALPDVPRVSIRTEAGLVDTPTNPRASHLDDANTRDDLLARASSILLSYKDVVTAPGNHDTDSPTIETPAAVKTADGVVGSTSSEAEGVKPIVFTPLFTGKPAPETGSNSVNTFSSVTLKVDTGVKPSPAVQLQHVYYMSPVDPVDYEEAADLVLALIGPDITAKVSNAGKQSFLSPGVALAHPFFWSVSRKFLFIQVISESLVVNADRAEGESAAFAAAIQTSFLSRLPAGVTSWSAVFRPPASLGAEGWESPLWTHKHPSEYEKNYSGPYSMYSLVRFIRNFYVHGPEHIRHRVFESLAHLEAYILSVWPWLIIELFHVDQAFGGRFTTFCLSGGWSGDVAHLVGGGVDADVDAAHAQKNVAATLSYSIRTPATGEDSDVTGTADTRSEGDSPAERDMAVFAGKRVTRPPGRSRVDSFAKDEDYTPLPPPSYHHHYGTHDYHAPKRVYKHGRIYEESELFEDEMDTFRHKHYRGKPRYHHKPY